MNKSLIRIITYLVVLSFSCQNFAWAGGDRFLAPDSKKDLAEVVDALKEHDGHEGSLFQAFSGIGKKSTAVPFLITPEIARRVSREVRGLIGKGFTGSISNRGEFIIPSERKKRKWIRLKRKVERIIKKINAEYPNLLGSSTTVRINTDINKPLFYNQDDNESVIEIHGALLLDDTPEDVLNFCCRHEARHIQISGLSPLMEELLNIYLDFEYIGSLTPQESTDLLAHLREMDGTGYHKILQKNELRHDRAWQYKFYKEIAEYIFNYCPWIKDKMGLRDISFEKFLKKAGGEIDQLNDILRCAGHDPECKGSLEQGSFAGHLLLPKTALFVYKNIEFFRRIDERIEMIAEAYKDEASEEDKVAISKVNQKYLEHLLTIAEHRGIIVSILDSNGHGGVLTKSSIDQSSFMPVYDIRTKKVIYVSNVYKNDQYYINGNLRYKFYELLKHRFSEEEISDIVKFLNEIWRDMDEPSFARYIKVAINMVKMGATVEGIKAGLAIDKSKNVPPHVFRVIEDYLNINSVLGYKLHHSRHTFQNVINLIIQLTGGNADSLMLVFADKINYLQELVEDKTKYDGLSEEEKNLLKQSIELICIPIAELFGRQEEANIMRALILKIELGVDGYKLEEERLAKTVGFEGYSRKDLEQVLDEVLEVIKKSIKGIPKDVRIEVSGRVKITYSFYYKPRETLDGFGIRFIIKSKHSPHEERKIRKILNECFAAVFDIYESQQKKFIEKRYNEYDFIAKMKPDTLEGIKFLSSHPGHNISVEIQIYPTEDDFKRYEYGPAAHWVYKFETVLKRMGINDQLFDKDILEKIYKDFVDGDMPHNLRLVYNALGDFIYVGAIDNQDNELRIMRASKETVPADILFSPMVGIDKAGSLRLKTPGSDNPVMDPAKPGLVPGVYEIEKTPWDENKLQEIKNVTKKIRTFLQVTRMQMRADDIDDNILVPEGKRMLSEYIAKQQVTFITAGNLKQVTLNDIENNLFVIKDEKTGQDIGLVNNALSLKSIDELYGMIAIIGKGEGEDILKELIKRTYQYVTGLQLDTVDFEKLKTTWGIPPEYPPIAVLIHLFMVPEYNKNYILNVILSMQTEPDIQTRQMHERKLLVLLDEFKVNNLLQLYTRAGLDNALYDVIKTRFQSILSPKIIVAAKNMTEEMKKDVDDAAGRSDIYVVSKVFSRERNKDCIELEITPGRYWLEKLDVILRSIRSIDGIESVELMYNDADMISANFELSNLLSIDHGQIKSSLEELFSHLRTVPTLKSEGEILEYELEVPVSIPLNILKDIIDSWLRVKLGMADGVVSLEPKPMGDDSGVLFIEGKKPDPAGVASIFPVFAGIDFSAGSINNTQVFSSVFTVVLYLLLGALGVYIIWRFAMNTLSKHKQKRFDEKSGRLFDYWFGYDKARAQNTPLLDPFYKEEDFAAFPGDIDFKDIINNMQIHRIEEVITRVSDTAYVSLERGVDGNFEVQGYKILGVYNKKLYRFFILEKNCNDIAFNPLSKDADTYFSLSPEITDLCRDTLLQKIENYRLTKPNGRFPPLARKVLVPMESRPEFEQLNRDSIICRSIVERFPRTGHSYPSFVHNKYVLQPDDPGFSAFYMPRAKAEPGTIARSLVSLPEGIDAVHELTHAVYDYSGEMRAKIVEHFNVHNNVRLKDTIVKYYGYDMLEEDRKEDLINEEFAYTLSEFAALRRPWNDVVEIGRIRDELNGMMIQEIRDKILYRINELQKLGLNGELNRFAVKAVQLCREYDNRKITEGKARTEYFDLIKQLREITISPPVRLLDVKFFAETGFIEPWMNPMELGYTNNDMKKDVDTEYYLRLVEFLIDRGNAGDEYYKMYSTDRWVKSPYGGEALSEGMRLAWILVKNNYGILNVSDIGEEKYDIAQFKSATSTSYMVNRVINAQSGKFYYKKGWGKGDIQKTRAIRFKRLKNILRGLIMKVQGSLLGKFTEHAGNGQCQAVKSLCRTYPWLAQVLFEEAFFEKPKVLLLDVATMKNLSEEGTKCLVEAINNVKGRVVIICDDNTMDYKGIEEIVRSFWSKNINHLSNKAFRRANAVLRDIYLRHGGESSINFAKRVYGDIQRKFKLEPEGVTIFTSAREFIEIWRDIAKNSLLFVLKSDTVYITSEQLFTLRVLNGNEDFDIRPGEQIKLLPEYFYGKDAMKELERIEAEQAA